MSVIPLSKKPRFNSAFTPEKSHMAATKKQFIKAFGVGKLSSSGIERYLRASDRDLIYIFHPNLRVVGTRDEIVAYTMGDPSDIDTYIGRFGLTRSTLSTHQPDEAYQAYQAEIGGIHKRTRKTFDIGAITSPFDQIKNIADVFKLKVDPILSTPLKLADLLYAQKHKIPSAGTLLGKINQLPLGKVLDVSNISPSGTKARAIDAPSSNKGGKRGHSEFPELRMVSDNYPSYEVALNILLREGLAPETVERAKVAMRPARFSKIGPSSPTYIPVASPVAVASPRIVPLLPPVIPRVEIPQPLPTTSPRVMSPRLASPTRLSSVGRTSPRPTRVSSL